MSLRKRVIINTIDHRGYYICDSSSNDGSGHYLYKDGAWRPSAAELVDNSINCFWPTYESAHAFFKQQYPDE